ncbi:MAG TPA: sugar ABC transporter ATP-binding protein, partial [Polyangiaceae bacterium]|nr:sugar ABC transporter ATP-binding protein [Polyangiaceae bacterium]
SRLEMVGITKSFGGVQALRGASLDARHGEILGLCGENGAGKSTLLKILSGVHPHASYQGEVRLEGQLLALADTAEAQRAGIAIVHQELMLVPELSVAANLLLGREPMRMGLVDDAAAEVKARELLGRYGLGDDIDPTGSVGELGIGLQQMVEIVRALSLETRVLVLDEPTAALTKEESERLMDWLRRLREQGTTCIYVSHRLDEVFALCDRITVLRDGVTVGTVETASSTADEVVSMMVGRALEARGDARGQPSEEVAIELEGLSLHAAGRFVLEGISLAVRRGEIVALCGAMGSGRTALLSTLFGCAEGGVSGSVRIDGRQITLRSPEEALAVGLALLPEDRKGRGLIMDMTVAQNLALPWLSSLSRAGLVDALAETLLAERRIAELRIRGAADDPVGTLSGGNQQKVVLGKWLERPPRVLLLDEPTRGVDVGAREEIYAILRELASRGAAVIFASSDLPEVLRLADRIVVLRQGRIQAEIDAASASEELLVGHSTGVNTPVGAVA